MTKKSSRIWEYRTPGGEWRRHSLRFPISADEFRVLIATQIRGGNIRHDLIEVRPVERPRRRVRRMKKKAPAH